MQLNLCSNENLRLSDTTLIILTETQGGIVANIWEGSIEKGSEVCEREEISLAEVYARVKKFIYLLWTIFNKGCTVQQGWFKWGPGLNGALEIRFEWLNGALQNLSFWSWNSPIKGLKMHFTAVQMPRKSSGFVIYSILRRKCICSS